MDVVPFLDRETFRTAVRDAVYFSYRNVLELFVVSVCWFIAALPIVTIGPATLGAYRVVISLRETESIDPRDVFALVRRQFVHAVLLGLLPLLFWGITLVYAVRYVDSRSTIALGLFLITFYIGSYLSMLSIPTFVALAHGESAYDGLAFGHSWLSDHLSAAFLTVLLTLFLAAVFVVLSVAFPVLFAGLAASLHVHVVDEA